MADQIENAAELRIQFERYWAEHWFHPNETDDERRIGETCFIAGVRAAALAMDGRESQGDCKQDGGKCGIGGYCNDCKQPTDDPVGYYVNSAPEGEPPHYEKVSEKFKNEPDVVPLYERPADFQVLQENLAATIDVLKQTRSERRVLAELLRDAVAVLRTFDPEDTSEGELLEGLIARAEAGYAEVLK